MKLQQLNKEMINEMSLKQMKDKAKSTKDNIVISAKKIGKSLKDEVSDNKAAFNIFKRKLLHKFGKHEVPTPEEFKKAIEQMGDNGRMLVLGFVGAAPGSALTIPLLLKAATKLGIKLTPTKTF